MKDSAGYAKVIEWSEEAVVLYRRQGKPLPPAISTRDPANRNQPAAARS
jgi:hypothetical protein